VKPQMNQLSQIKLRNSCVYQPFILYGPHVPSRTIAQWRGIIVSKTLQLSMELLSTPKLIGNSRLFSSLHFDPQNCCFTPPKGRKQYFTVV